MGSMRIPPRFGALLAVIFWGISFVATKAALREVSPITLIFMRFAIGALLLLAVVRKLPPRDALPQLALMGFLGVFGWAVQGFMAKYPTVKVADLLEAPSHGH